MNNKNDNFPVLCVKSYYNIYIYEKLLCRYRLYTINDQNEWYFEEILKYETSENIVIYFFLVKYQINMNEVSKLIFLYLI
jgi:hypothetical protein